jgi:hypothetical protein
LNNCDPPRERLLLKGTSASGERCALRTSQKSFPTLRDIIQLFAPHRDRVIFDPCAGIVSTAVAGLAQRMLVSACERDKKSFELARKRIHEYGYNMAPRYDFPIPDAQCAMHVVVVQKWVHLHVPHAGAPTFWTMGPKMGAPACAPCGCTTLWTHCHNVTMSD